jgi:hypothetical protein
MTSIVRYHVWKNILFVLVDIRGEKFKRQLDMCLGLRRGICTKDLRVTGLEVVVEGKGKDK